MKVAMTVELTARDRYVIAKHYGGRRSRATREQARRFVRGAVSWALREQAGALPRRQRGVVDRLADGQQDRPAEEVMVEPIERQMDLFAGAGIGNGSLIGEGTDR